MSKSNDLLEAILGTLSKIEKNTNGNSSETSAPKGNVGSISGKLGNISEKASEINLKSLSNFLGSLAKSPMVSVKITALSKSLDKLFTVFVKFGNPVNQMKINSALIMLNKMALGLTRVANPLLAASSAFIGFGMGMILFVGSLALISAVLGAENIMMGISSLLLVFTSMIGIFWAVNKSRSVIWKGSKVMLGMGEALLSFSVGMIGVAIALKTFSVLLGAGSILEGFTEMALVFTGMFFVYKLLGNNHITIKKGASVMNTMAKSLLSFSLGMITVALTIALLPEILGGGSLGEGIIMFSLVFLVTFGMMALIGSSAELVDNGSRVMKSMGSAMMIFSLGIISVALTLAILPSILETDSMMKSVLMFTGIFLGIGAMMYFLGRSKELVEPGVEVLYKMGGAMMMFSLGILAVAIVSRLATSILFSGSVEVDEEEKKGPMAAIWRLGTFGVIAGGMIGLFVGLGAMEGTIKKGIGVATGVSVGIMLLSLAVLSVAFVAKKAGDLLWSSTSQEGEESDAGGWAAAKKLGMFGGILIAFGLVFALLGSPIGYGIILPGAGVGIAMGIAMIVISKGILEVAKTSGEIAKIMSNMPKPEGDEIDPAYASLGYMATILGGAIGLFGILGIPGFNLVILMGAGVAIGIANSMIKIAEAVKAVFDVTKEIDSQQVATNITDVLTSLVKGFSDGLAPLFDNGGGGFFDGITQGMFNKNITQIKLGTDVLNYIALSISSLARGMMAFAELGTFYDLESDGEDADGRKKFKKGKKVSVVDVAKNISTSLTIFISEFSKLSENLTDFSSDKLIDMSVALLGTEGSSFLGISTGKKKPGILEPVIKFAEVLKTFAGTSGTSGEIAFEVYDPETKRNKKINVKTTDVAKNIASAFVSFVEELGNLSTTLSLDKNDKMQELAIALMGSAEVSSWGITTSGEKPGLLKPIIKFADVLNTFAKMEYSEDGNIKMPLFNSKGEQVGSIDAKKIGTNIITSLNSFVEGMAAQETTDKIKSANTNIGKFEDLIESVKDISEAMDPLVRFTNTIGKLAENITLLSKSLAELNTEKLNGVIESSNLYNEKLSKQASNTQAQKNNLNNGAENEPNGGNLNNVNWDLVSAQIGESVGQHMISAMKDGQVKFEFSPTNNNKGIIELDFNS
jgi:hypothetical protein